VRIEYWAPLGRAWERMKALLFRPFEPAKWLILALCAWLASLLEGGSGGGGGRFRPPSHGGVSPGRVFHSFQDVWLRIVEGWEWLRGHWGLSLVVFVGVPLVLAVLLGLVWISSRFKLIYLDNLVRGRAVISEPWTRLARLGDSLFLFRVAFGVVVLAVGAVLVGALVTLGIVSFAGGPRSLSITGLIVAIPLLLLLVGAVAYASLFLRSFVVPIMYRHDLGATAAWRILLSWVGTYPGVFFLYGLFVLLLFIGAGMAIAVAGLLTCCIGFVLLALPFVGTVLLLPLLVTYRYLSLEFLAQFDRSLDVFDRPLPPGVPAGE
jgi:hypothetical protein